MAKIVRKNMKIFGSSAGPNQRGVFGSLAAGVPAYSDDPETIQSLSNYLEGWYGAVLGNNSPAIQDMNALQFLFAYQLAYGFQAGIAEWDDATTYYTGSFVQSAGVIYVSLVDDNLNNAVSDPTKWAAGIVTSSIQDLAITTGKLNNLAVTTGKLAAGAVTDAKTAFTAPTNSWANIGSAFGGFSAGTTGTYTPPAGVKWIKVRMVGGGGGGGGTGSGTTLSGDGGGAGSYIEFIIANPTAVSFTIGAAGAGATAGFNAGGGGGSTIFGTRTAGGGAGGGAGSNTGHNSGGAGGTSTGAGGGDLILDSWSGLAMSSGNQNRGTGGQGGSSPFGQGGSGGVATNAGGGVGGQAGMGFGAGGGGGGGGSGSAAGGAGTGGLIYIEEHYQ